MKESIGLDFFAKPLYPSHLAKREDTTYFIGKRANLDTNAYDSDLYCLRDGGAHRLTNSLDVGCFALLEEGIVFPSLRNPKDKEASQGGEALTVFYRLPYDGGEAQEYLRLPYAVTQTEWLPDGKLLFLATYDIMLERFARERDGDRKKALKRKREQDEALTVIDELPFWFNGRGFTNKLRTALFFYDGSETRMLTGEYDHIELLKLNCGKTKALFAMKTYKTAAPLANSLYLLDIVSQAFAPVTGIPEGSVEDFTFAPDDTVLYLFKNADADGGLDSDNAQLHSISQGGGTHTLLDDSGAYDYYNSVGSDSKLGNEEQGLTCVGGGISFLCTLLHDSHILRYDLKDGAFHQVTKEAGMVIEFIPDGEGYAMIAMRSGGLPEIYTVTAEGVESRASRLNDALLEAYETVTPLEISFTNEKGAEIFGWVMPPVGYVPGMVYPAILNIHGGPKTVYGSVFFHEMQYWCAQGFAVLFCNPTGGDGRGDAFADIRGAYGQTDYHDIMQFVDEALTRFGFISSMHIGVTGGSYGGFMTNWIIGHTDRFQAAASQRSISNWIGFFGTSDIGHTFGNSQMQGTPWTAPEKLWNMSPLKYADQVKTPTLFIHSEEDYRCNMFEGIQMYYALRAFGVDTRLCLFKGENHELSRSGKPKNRIRRLKEITRWMEKHLRTVQ